MLAKIASYYSLDNTRVVFDEAISTCNLNIYISNPGSPELIAMLVSFNLVYTLPALVVVISCVITVVVLTRSNRNVQQRELQKSRNRATVTILLFALICGIYNAPLVTHYIVWTCVAMTGNCAFYLDFHGFDKHYYYRVVVFSLLTVMNSAANPVLYFWRMKPMREYTTAGMKKIQKRPAVINRQ